MAKTYEQITCAAVLFDMDGTLVDSTAIVESAWEAWANRHSLPLAGILAFSHGRPTRETMDHFRPGLDCSSDAAEMLQYEERTIDGITAVAGAREAVLAVQNAAWAVVTSATRRLAEIRLTAAGLPIPCVLVSSEDIRHGKPDPEGYLKAAARLNVAPADCLVFEDTWAGIEAARRAGMRAIGLLTTVAEERLGCDCVIEDFRRTRLERRGTGVEIVFV